MAAAVWFKEFMAVMITGAGLRGITVGAVKSPAGLMEPADADHVTAVVAMNCCVAPRTTVAVLGEIFNDGGGAANGTARIFEKSEPGFLTLTATVCAVP